MNLIKLIRQARQHPQMVPWALGGMFSIPSGLALGSLYGPSVGVAAATLLLILYLMHMSLRELVMIKRVQMHRLYLIDKARMNKSLTNLEAQLNTTKDHPTP